MKKRLMALLTQKEERKRILGNNGAKTESVEELRSINTELDTLNGEIAELRGMIGELPDDEGEGTDPQQRSQVTGGGDPVGATAVIGTYGVQRQQQQQERSTDKFDTVEYRSAFMDYVTQGKKTEGLEFRADATTGTGDIGAVIPTTILNKIVEKMKDFGMIYSRVTKTAVQGGVQIPTSNAKPKATWVAAGKMSDKQKKEVKGYISFKYHKLQCRVAVELVAGVVAMPVFEQTITENIYEAMIVAIEEGIISGDGNGQPLGITKDPDIPEDQIIEVDAADFGKYNTWTELFGKVPRKYRGGNVLIMADPDWTKYIEGMLDENGQPVARVINGLDGTIQEKLIGRDVIPVEEYLPSIDDADEGEIVGIICKLSDYMFNTNMQLTFKRYFNEETDENVSKSTLIADGKLADRNGVVLLKKKTVAAGE